MEGKTFIRLAVDGGDADPQARPSFKAELQEYDLQLPSCCLLPEKMTPSLRRLLLCSAPELIAVLVY